MTAIATEIDRPRQESQLGISEVAEATGLTLDTLRWYEREGLFPRVERDVRHRRVYTPRHVRLLQMVVRLRRTGMPTKEVREFSRLLGEGQASHGRRLALLDAHRDRIVAQLASLQEDLAVLDEKAARYRELIAQGLDCDGSRPRSDGSRPETEER